MVGASNMGGGEVAERFTREDMVDAIATAISDSFDVDWNSHTGAEAVVRNCGVFELYEALTDAEAVLRDIPAPHSWPLWSRMCRAMQQAERVLAKARGEQQ